MPKVPNYLVLSDNEAATIIRHLTKNYRYLREVKNLVRKVAIQWERVKNRLANTKVREVSRIDRMLASAYLNIRDQKRVKILMFVVNEMKAVVEGGVTKNNIRTVVVLLNDVDALNSKIRQVLNKKNGLVSFISTNY